MAERKNPAESAGFFCVTGNSPDWSQPNVGVLRKQVNGAGGRTGTDTLLPKRDFESAGFSAFFGFDPDYTSFAVEINGDDAVELFCNNVVVDVFGDINVDGTGTPWEHLDGWAYRVSNTGPDGSTFVLTNWSFSGPNALASEVTDIDMDDPSDNMDSNFEFSFTTTAPVVVSPMIINEVDADQSGTDSAEFVELYDGGAGNTPLDGLVVVLFNGFDDASYLAFDLDGQTTDTNGFFVLCGNPGSVPNCSLDVGASSNLIQNGADAVALFQGDASSFPNDMPLTTGFLIDALVYDTNNGDDAALLALLNSGQPQVNEDGAGNKNFHSNQRCQTGMGDACNTDTYEQSTPTPGQANNCAPVEIFAIQGKVAVQLHRLPAKAWQRMTISLRLSGRKVSFSRHRMHATMAL